jgi:hypothetical protein
MPTLRWVRRHVVEALADEGLAVDVLGDVGCDAMIARTASRRVLGWHESDRARDRACRRTGRAVSRGRTLGSSTASCAVPYTTARIDATLHDLAPRDTRSGARSSQRACRRKPRRSHPFGDLIVRLDEKSGLASDPPDEAPIVRYDRFERLLTFDLGLGERLHAAAPGGFRHGARRCSLACCCLLRGRRGVRDVVAGVS